MAFSSAVFGSLGLVTKTGISSIGNLDTLSISDTSKLVSILSLNSSSCSVGIETTRLILILFFFSCSLESRDSE